MLQPTVPEKLNNKDGLGVGSVHEPHCEWEIEWTLSVDGGKVLEREMGMGTEGFRCRENGGREYWERQLKLGAF